MVSFFITESLDFDWLLVTHWCYKVSIFAFVDAWKFRYLYISVKKKLLGHVQDLILNLGLINSFALDLGFYWNLHFDNKKIVPFFLCLNTLSFFVSHVVLVCYCDYTGDEMTRIFWQSIKEKVI